MTPLVGVPVGKLQTALRGLLLYVLSQYAQTSIVVFEKLATAITIPSLRSSLRTVGVSAPKEVKQMKKFVFPLLAVAVVTTGLIAGRARPNQKRTSVTPSTIVFTFTDYGTDGSVLGVSRMTRRQFSDGTWKTRVELPDGTFRDSSGRITPGNLVTPAEYRAHTTDRLQDSVLGYNVVIQLDARQQAWYSPELDTLLQHVIYDKDGTLSDVLEAVEITEGEPSKP